jgi:hypothetical protein
MIAAVKTASLSIRNRPWVPVAAIGRRSYGSPCKRRVSPDQLGANLVKFTAVVVGRFESEHAVWAKLRFPRNVTLPPKWGSKWT